MGGKQRLRGLYMYDGGSVAQSSYRAWMTNIWSSRRAEAFELRRGRRHVLLYVRIDRCSGPCPTQLYTANDESVRLDVGDEVAASPAICISIFLSDSY